MVLSKTDIQEIRKRLGDTDGGIKHAAMLGGITEQAAHKVLKGEENCRQATIDAFLAGVARLETAEAEQRQINSERARGILAA